jgi:hypothetical protein
MTLNPGDKPKVVGGSFSDFYWENIWAG